MLEPMARAWRRRQFAVPLVIVVGCSQPTPRTEPVPDQPVSQPQPMTPDAAPIDAAVALAPDGAPSRCDRDPTAGGCNPPRPEKARMEVHVTTVHGVRNGRLEFDFTPHDDSIAWKGKFIDDAGVDIPNSEFTVVGRQATGRMRGAATQVPSKRARLYEVDR